MDGETAQRVKGQITDLVRRAMARNLQEGEGDYNPFRTRLIPDSHWRLPKFERSFVTSMGSSGYEQLGKIIAEGAGHTAERGHELHGTVTTGQRDFIGAVLADLRANRSRPDWEAESEGVVSRRGSGQKVEVRVISDLYVRTVDGREKFFTMKTVKPNLDQTEKAKSDCLHLLAVDPGHEPYFSLAYNPYGDDRSAYAWGYASRIFDMRRDGVVLIGKGFWDELGGEGTYERLLEVFEGVGEELREEIEAFMRG